jgi:hypothetical protein
MLFERLEEGESRIQNGYGKAEEAVKKWLEENGYDYEVGTYMPGR